jgi:nicotinate-nucleotide adenylyltransferase
MTLFAADTIYFFGTFNPIHVGHLMMAQAALNWAHRHAPTLTSVSLVVSGSPPHRQHQSSLAPAHDRLKMARLALGGLPWLKVLDIECHTPGPHYTAETLSRLHPGLGHLPDQAKVPVLMGSDCLGQLASWHMPKTLIHGVTFLQVPRPEVPPVVQLVVGNTPMVISTHMIDMPPVDISATWIRQQLALGHNVRPWLAPLVGDYVMQNNLYG